MRYRSFFLAATLLAAASPVAAASYIAIGDSITFGETDLFYRPSDGYRGYVDDFAQYLAAKNGGTPLNVFNLAIDGETTNSFISNAGRVPPVTGRGDVPLQLENTHYADNSMSQGALFAKTVAGQKAAGDPVTTITVTLGFNDLAALVGQSDQQVTAGLAAYRARYADILTNVRTLTPDANLYLLGYYNPFPADPTNPAAPTFNTYGMALNGIIQALAGQFGATYVDTATPFVGHEREYTYLDEQPHGFYRDGPFPGVEPIGNVHPNETGYAVIARQIEATPAVPEPASWAMLLVGFGAVGGAMRYRRRRTAVAYA